MVADLSDIGVDQNRPKWTCTRRWMFQQPGSKNKSLTTASKSSCNGDKGATKIPDNNPTVSPYLTWDQRSLPQTGAKMTRRASA